MLLNHSSPVERSLDRREERLWKSMPVIFSRFEVGEEERVPGLYCSFTSRQVLEFSRTLCTSPLIVVSFPDHMSASWSLTPLGLPYQLRASNSEFIDLWVSTTWVSWEYLQLCKSEFLWPQTIQFTLWLPYTFVTVRAMPMVHIDLCDHRSADICFPLYSHKLYVLNFMLYIWVWALSFSFIVVIDFSLDFYISFLFLNILQLVPDSVLQLLQVFWVWKYWLGNPSAFLALFSHMNSILDESGIAA